MEYQELIDLCKQAYNNKDLSSAYEFYKQLYQAFNKKLSITLDKQECYQEYFKALEQFTNEQIYKITDYGKMKEQTKYIRW